MSDTGKIVSLVKALGGGSGGGSGLPTGGAPHQMLVTDANGVTQWEDRLCYEAWEDVVCLPETTLTRDTDSNMFLIQDFSATPVVDGIYTVTINKEAVFACTGKTAMIDGAACTILGNTVVVDGESTGEPFTIIIWPKELVEMMGTAALMDITDTSSSVTLSIVGKQPTIKKIDPKFVEIKGETIFLDVIPDDFFTGILDSYPYSFYMGYINSGKNLVLRLRISPDTNPDWHVLLTLAGVNNTGIVFHGGVGHGGITVRLTIHEDGNNTLESHPDKLILTDPNGAVWYIKVSEDGTLTTSQSL